MPAPFYPCFPCSPTSCALPQGLEKGLPIVNLMENWDFLQVRVLAPWVQGGVWGEGLK